MKKFFLTTALTLLFSIFMQGYSINPKVQVPQLSSEDISGANQTDNSHAKTTGCKDCDAVKQAIKASHASSGHPHRKSFSMKKWGNKLSGRMHMKMQKMLAHRKKIRTSYEICFDWK
jgi:hypothetical protein